MSNLPNQTDPRLLILDKAYGHKKSVDQKLPINSKGEPIPWYTYPAIEYLERINFKEASFFEYGSGHSTLYWSNRVKNITSVESNKEWYKKILKETKSISNIKLQYEEEKESYCHSILTEKIKYDVVIIDGIYRASCVFNAIKALNGGGIVILDNSDWYVGAAKALRSTGLTQVDFDGLGPGNNYTWVTSIYLKSNMKFKHTESTSENFSKGGRKVAISG